MRTVDEEARRATQIRRMENASTAMRRMDLPLSVVREIAKACDCSVAALYLYFDNPDAWIVPSAADLYAGPGLRALRAV